MARLLYTLGIIAMAVGTLVGILAGLAGNGWLLGLIWLICGAIVGIIFIALGTIFIVLQENQLYLQEIARRLPSHPTSTAPVKKRPNTKMTLRNLKDYRMKSHDPNE